MRSEFLDIASHQLRTPISVISGYTDMLLSGDYKNADEKEINEVYQAIAIKTKKLRHIIADILYASEFDTGQFKLHPDDLLIFDIVPFLEYMLQEHLAEAKLKDITLKFEKAPTKPLVVRASQRYLEVVLDNLVMNALQYTQKKGTIKLQVQEKKEVIRIEVKDNGIGIPKKEHKGLFNKFKRAANANIMHTDGSGLGLFIASEIMQAHPKGNIGFTSAGEGRGATFWIEVKKHS